MSNVQDIINSSNEQGTCILVDTAVLGDRNVIKKEAETLLKYEHRTV